MILIAHRGNITGPMPSYENRPEYIAHAMHQGYDVEIDVWYKDGAWWLGHDEPHYQTTFEFLSTLGLWVHCKDYQTFKQMAIEGEWINFFYHTTEDYVLTSKGYIWAYPGMDGGEKTICCLPEWNDRSVEGFAGVCSDYIENYK